MNAQTKVEPQTLAQAMTLAFAEIESATKAAKGQVGKSAYFYADLTSVIEAIKPALVKHNLFFTQHPRPNDRGVEVETILHHAGGETFSLGSLFVPAANLNAQGFGSALTYARRYGLVTAFGVPVEDDDGSAASAPQQKAGPQLIGDAQWSELVALIEATNTDAGKFCGAFNVDSVKVLPAAAFPKAKAMLERKLAQMGEKADA